MTTIKIKEEIPNLSRTEFESVSEMLDWFVDTFQDESPLSEEIIAKGEEAEREIDSPDSTFRPVP